MLKAPPFKKVNRSAYLNFLQAKYEAYTGAVDVRSYPYYLCLDPCDICQLRCPTCPTGIENESRKQRDDSRILYRSNRSMMTTELFDALIDEMGEYLFLIMFYNWGEPLLNKQLPAFIRKARSHQIETEVHTNLSLPLSDQQIDDLMGSGLDYLNLSIDGFTQETYQVHRVGGDIELVKKNLSRLVAARQRLGAQTRISYKFLVFKFNEHEVPAARRYCEDLGINFIYGDAFISDPEWLPSHRRHEKPYYDPQQMQALMAKAEAAGAGDYFADHEKHPYWFPARREADATSPAFCSWHYGVSVVTAGGPVAPCCATAKERDDFGKVSPGTTTFAEVWTGDRYRRARADFSGRPAAGLKNVDTVCSRCHFPKFVQQLYSSHDAKVIAQYQRALGGQDPRFDAAFRILSRKRYGRVVDAFLRRGWFHPLLQLFAGNGDERDTEMYRTFFEQYLSAEPGAREVKGAVS